MRINRLGLIAAAFLAGVCGGLVPLAFHLESVSAASLHAMRATRFELVDERGRVRAAVEPDQSGGATLRFFDAKQGTPLELGVSSGGKPFLRLLGSDGRVRMSLKLLEADKPTLLMGDDTSEQRLQLGALQPSDSSGSKFDIWALLLGNPIDRELLVGLSMNTSSGRGADLGVLSVRASDGRRWDAPLDSSGNRTGEKR